MQAPRAASTGTALGTGVQALAQRVRPAWPIAQQTAAAVTAWLIAARLAGHDDPFFAPVAAVVGLNATLGRRGSNTLHLLTGAIIGVLVGQLALWMTGAGVVTLAFATFTAMLLARAVDQAWIVQAQAAVSAILISVLGDPGRGWDRLVDAVIGSLVALAFSQLLFTPEPLRLLRRTESAVLSKLADGLGLTAHAIENNSRRSAQHALGELRHVRDDLADMDTARKASGRIVRHSITWRRRAVPLVAEQERADQLDLLAGSCLMLTRTAMAVPDAARGPLAATLRRLAGTMSDLSADPGGQAVRQDAADGASSLARWLIEHGGTVPAQSGLAAACAAVRMIAVDLMVFAGVDPEQAFEQAQNPNDEHRHLD